MWLNEYFVAMEESLVHVFIIVIRLFLIPTLAWERAVDLLQMEAGGSTMAS
jgi:hypothetical protein